MTDSDLTGPALTGPAPQPDGPVSVIDYSERIPNNVDLATDRMCASTATGVRRQPR